MEKEREAALSDKDLLFNVAMTFLPNLLGGPISPQVRVTSRTLPDRKQRRLIELHRTWKVGQWSLFIIIGRLDWSHDEMNRWKASWIESLLALDTPTFARKLQFLNSSKVARADLQVALDVNWRCKCVQVRSGQQQQKAIKKGKCKSIWSHLTTLNPLNRPQSTFYQLLQAEADAQRPTLAANNRLIWAPFAANKANKTKKFITRLPRLARDLASQIDEIEPMVIYCINSFTIQGSALLSSWLPFKSKRIPRTCSTSYLRCTLWAFVSRSSNQTNGFCRSPAARAVHYGSLLSQSAILALTRSSYRKTFRFEDKKMFVESEAQKRILNWKNDLDLSKGEKKGELILLMANSLVSINHLSAEDARFEYCAQNPLRYRLFGCHWSHLKLDPLARSNSSLLAG